MVSLTKSAAEYFALTDVSFVIFIQTPTNCDDTAVHQI